jgi:uncharacterized protein (TIGR02246 family)
VHDGGADEQWQKVSGYDGTVGGKGRVHCWRGGAAASSEGHRYCEEALMPKRDVQEWIDKLEIRELIERGMRYLDDCDGDRLAELFAEDGVMQLAGTVIAGREAIRSMFPNPTTRPWTERGELLKQPAAAHWSSNPVITIDDDVATAETDMIVVERDENGKAVITLAARYRDRLRRIDDRWQIVNRTGVSIARRGEEDTDAEWARALGRMTPELRAQFRTD